MRIGYILVHKNVISRGDLILALSEQNLRTNGSRPAIGEVILSLGMCTEDELRDALDEQLESSLAMPQIEARLAHAQKEFSERWAAFSVLQDEAMRQRTDEFNIDDIQAEIRRLENDVY